MNRFANHIKRWNAWRKGNTNSFWHKLLVLLKLRQSPTFEMYFVNIPDSTIFAAARGNAKSNMAMELWRIKLGIPDDEWEEIKREVKKEMFGEEKNE